MTNNKSTDKEYKSIKEAILNTLSQPSYDPVKASKVIRLAGVPAEQRVKGREIISDLLDEGQILSIDKRKIILAEKAELIQGRIHFTRSGAAYVNTDDKEIFIPPPNVSTALPNDIVQVRINKKREHVKANSYEGSVVRVVDRHQLTIVGTLFEKYQKSYILPMT